MLYPRDANERNLHEMSEKVGFLSEAQSFRVEVLDDKAYVLHRLWRLFCAASVPDMNVEMCNQCGGGADMLICLHGEGKRMLLGNSYAIVYCPSEPLFCASDMTMHYIAAHDYFPGNEFITALKKMSIPPTTEYFRNLARWGCPVNIPDIDGFDEFIDDGQWPAQPKPIPIRNEWLM